MVQISLFDIEEPPEAISGEARALSPLDTIIFTPLGPIRAGGERVVSSIFTQISKLFAPKAVIPTSKTITQIAPVIGSRAPGAPFRQAGSVISESSATAGLVSAASKTGGSTFRLPSFSSPFSGKIKPNTALKSGTALGVTGGALFGINQLTQTQGGQDLTKGIGEFGTNVTEFAANNPLLIAGGLIIAAVLVVKS